MGDELSVKIKQLRLKRNMTLEQVAVIVGVGRSTVRKWETGMIANMGRDKISLLARALGTTPAYLMGWEDETDTNDEITITESEQFLLDLFRQVPADKQEMVLQMIKIALGNQ